MLSRLLYHERRQLSQDNSWVTLNKRSPVLGNLIQLLQLPITWIDKRLLFVNVNKLIYFAGLFGMANMWYPPTPLHLTKLPCPPSTKRKGKKSEGKETQKETKMINCLKINYLHAIFTHFANVENYMFFTLFFFMGGGLSNIWTSPFTKFMYTPDITYNDTTEWETQNMTPHSY